MRKFLIFFDFSGEIKDYRKLLFFNYLFTDFEVKLFFFEE